jgi:hypothetical protein
VAVRHDESQGGLTFAEARRTGLCQRCGTGGGRVCGYRYADVADDGEPWWIAVMCRLCRGEAREDGLRVLAEVPAAL